MGVNTVKRPGPITITAILWLLLGIYNLYVSFQGISSDLGAWDLLSDPYIHEWVKMAIPTELALNSVVLIAALFQLMVVPGLLTGKSWSYPIALAVPLIIAVINLVFGALSASAPAEISSLIGSGVTQAFAFGIFQMIMLFGFWSYLNKPDVQTFLGRNQIITPIKESSQIKKEAPSKEEEVKEKEKDGFYCRYCGTENELDAVFCEKCGKKLK